MDIPKDEDWGGCDKYCYKLFGGKSIEQSLSLFQSNVAERADELQDMPPIPFQYYMLAFKEYVMSDAVFEEFEAADAASSFLSLVENKLKDQAEDIKPIMGDLMPAVEHVANNQEKYEASEDVHGNFLEQLTRIKDLTK